MLNAKKNQFYRQNIRSTEKSNAFDVKLISSSWKEKKNACTFQIKFHIRNTCTFRLIEQITHWNGQMNEKKYQLIQICLPIGEYLNEIGLPFSKCFFIIKIAARRWTWAQITTSIRNVLIGVICWHVDGYYSFRKKYEIKSATRVLLLRKKNGQTCFGKEKARIARCATPKRVKNLTASLHFDSNWF